MSYLKKIGFQMTQVQVPRIMNRLTTRNIIGKFHSTMGRGAPRSPKRSNRTFQKDGDREPHLTEQHGQLHDKGATSSESCWQLFPSQNPHSSQITHQTSTQNQDQVVKGSKTIPLTFLLHLWMDSIATKE